MKRAPLALSSRPRPPLAALVLALMSILALPLASQGQSHSHGASDSDDFSIEGRYERIDPPQPTSSPDKVEVVEVFWYGCPHCNSFLPYMHRWAQSKPDYVAFTRMPAIFRPSWEIHARAYYTARELDAIDKLHPEIFRAIHQHGRRLDSREELAAFFAEHGVPEAEFAKHYASFGVDTGVRRSKVMQVRYGVRGTPSVIVNGKYRVSGSTAGSYDNVLKVIDALVDKEHKAMLSQK